jgi:UPF0755 protein
MQDAPPQTGRHRARRPHWGLRISLVLLLLIAGSGFAAIRYYDWCQEASGPKRPVTFEVAEGTSGSEIVDALAEREVVRCALVSKWLLRQGDHEGDFRAGSFELTTNMTPEKAFEVLTAPLKAVPVVRLTIPEGYRLTQIAERVAEDVGIPERRFLAALEEGGYALEPYLPPDAESIEGFLFPETYQFAKRGTTPDDVIRRLLDQFATEAEAFDWSAGEGLGVTPYEVVIVASMIEKEAALDEERALIAGVIYNRLGLDMPLGIDATLLYADPTPDGQLSFSDLETDTPYNTRIRVGLPPTPIASPGRASLAAALAPEDTEFLYYVLCGEDGHHEFGRSLEEHEANRVTCDE